jgi:hypothetical protein
MSAVSVPVAGRLATYAVTAADDLVLGWIRPGVSAQQWIARTRGSERSAACPRRFADKTAEHGHEREDPFVLAGPNSRGVAPAGSRLALPVPRAIAAAPICDEEMAVRRQTPASRASADIGIWTPERCILFERRSIIYRRRGDLVTGCSSRRIGDHKTAHVPAIDSGPRFHLCPFYTEVFVESAACTITQHAPLRKTRVLTWALPSLIRVNYPRCPRIKGGL